MIGAFRMGVIASAVRIATGSPSDLLLHYEGTGFVDSGIHGLTVTTYGSVTSTTQAKFGTKSLDYSSCISVSDAALAPGTGDFKFETWIYMLNAGGQQFIFDQRNPGGMCVYHTGSNLNFYDGTTASNYAYTGPTITANTWHHIEVCRKAGVVYLFMDGVLGMTATVTSNWLNPTWVMAAAQYTPIGVNRFLGYLDETRIVIGPGSADHTANFTPPTAPYLP